MGTLFDQRATQRPAPYVEAPRSEALTDAELKAAFVALRCCVREYYQAGLWDDIQRLCRSQKQADAYRLWMSQHATEVAFNPADVRAPKVIEGRRTIKSMNLRRTEEVDLVLRMPSRSDKTVTYKVGLRVPDEVRRRDGAMIPLREQVKHCSCPDFTKRYLVQGMNTPWQTPDAVTQPWCKHIATAMWVIASDYRVVFSEDIRDASSAPRLQEQVP